MKFKLTPALARKIHQEAKALGLQPNEYLRLILAIAGHLRDGIGATGKLQAREMLELVENPIFGILFSTVTQSIIKQQTTSENDSTSLQPKPGDAAAESAVPQPHPPVLQQPLHPWYPGHVPQPYPPAQHIPGFPYGQAPRPQAQPAHIWG